MQLNANIEQINDLPFGRAYKVTKEDGSFRYLPSVTTVLKLNQDPFITHLKEELGPKRFKEIQNRGADRGTVMHRWLEEFFEHYKDGYDPEASLIHTQKYMADTEEFDGLPSSVARARRVGRNLFYNFYNSRFHNNIGRVLANEQFLYTFFKGGWAGTCDFVYEDRDGKLVILDYKSSSVPKDPEKLDNYKMQTACYMFKYAELSGRMPDRGEIVISNEMNSDLQWVTVPASDMKTHLRRFLGLLEEFRTTPEWVEFDEKVHVGADI